MEVMAGYVRVSRVGARQGASYISPTVQEDAIRAWAERNDIELDEMVAEEDVSGTKDLSKRDLGRLVERCERGEIGGIAVHKVDRFSRSPRDTFEALDRMQKAGARLVGVSDGVDSNDKSGELVITVLAGIAREQWRARRDGWKEATSRAVADGVHICRVPPAGYKRTGKRSRLEVDPQVAPVVHEVFLRRAKGESWQSLADYMTENGCTMSKSGVGGMLQRRVYLGEASGAKKGECTPNAHPPLVTLEEFEAAQGRGKPFARDGSLASQGMLSGLITCAGCGHRLSVGRSGRQKERRASYVCKARFSGLRDGRCPAPASSAVEIVDGFVAKAISLAVVDGTLHTTLDAVARHERAVRARDKAQRDLDAIKSNPKLIASLGVEGVAEMAVAQKAVLDEARKELRATPAPRDAISPDAELWTGEQWDIPHQRQLAKQLIAEITLERSGKGRWGAPVQERVKIRWAGYDDFDSDLAKRVLDAPAEASRLLGAATA